MDIGRGMRQRDESNRRNTATAGYLGANAGSHRGTEKTRFPNEFGRDDTAADPSWAALGRNWMKDALYQSVRIG